MTTKNSNDSQTAPVTVGEIITAKVQSVGEKGDGIIRTKGFVIFVPGVSKGDFIKLKIEKIKSNVGFGKFIEKVEPFEEKIERKDKRIPTPEELKNRSSKPKEDLTGLLTTEGDSEDF
jgi:predicted RNA-binding protein with TRAM domain